MYTVDNAIIMAAGLSRRFLPLSLEKPKSLWKVKGEVLIERQISQLKEVGINDITIVVGYMKEKFEYLTDKYGVKIKVSKDYYRYNNTSSLMEVLDEIKNTYICSSDNYFVTNPFKKRQNNSVYPIVYKPDEKGEYYVSTNSDDKIIDVSIGKGEYALIGAAFFDENFSAKFKSILLKEYNKKEVKENLWEHLFIKHLDVLNMYAEKMNAYDMKEFDSLEELKEFDDSYNNFNGSCVLNNISDVLECQVNDIADIRVLDGGLTNSIFTFKVHNEKFVYRHPGKGTEEYINRESEKVAHILAQKISLDPSLIWIDSKGEKISKYIENYRYFSYKNKEDVKVVLDYMKKLHKNNYKIGYEFDIKKEITNFYRRAEKYGVSKYPTLSLIKNNVLSILDKLDYDHCEKCLCHNDIYPTNFLMTETSNYLIDWEFASDTHPAFDLATFIVCSPFDEEEIDSILRIYLDSEDNSKYLEFYRYFYVSSFYWLLWALFQESNGQSTEGFLEKYYDYLKLFEKKVDVV